ncbi:hypothetical protein EAO72_27935 [Streptomyces sp. or43]|nr:hypothetical protein EAO72_27935 [Streptomyces sp. or43]
MASRQSAGRGAGMSGGTGAGTSAGTGAGLSAGIGAAMPARLSTGCGRRERIVGRPAQNGGHD